jgi:predicted nonribosomal peptide synthetase
MSNVLITGATGFLGIHVLYEGLKHNDKVYCIVRGENLESAQKKLYDKFLYYFGESKSQQYWDKVNVLVGDFCEEYFGLAYGEYLKLGNNVSKVIHCGAIVKHFGKKDDFYKINVKGTRNVCRFCFEFNKYMLFTSSIAVVIKKEADEYVKSKIEAENVVMTYKKKGMRCSSVRIGTLTGRYTDGMFQKNIRENALYSRLKNILQSRILPSDLLNKRLEFLPVDICAKEICNWVENEKQGCVSFHNYSTFTYRDLISFFSDLGYTVRVKDYMDFVNYFREMNKFGLGKETLTGFYLTMKRYRAEKNDLYDRLTCEGNIGPIIDKEYIKKVIEHMKKVEFINV